MKKGISRRQVDPRITIVAILAVLGVVQWVWWKGLVAKRAIDNHPIQATSSPRGMSLIVLGREDVLVDTIAGDPEPGDTDGPGRDARFDGPCGLTFDGAGNLIVADSRNHRIRMIAPDGSTTTRAGTTAGYMDGPVSGAKFSSPTAVGASADGTIYVADTGNNCIRTIKYDDVSTLAPAKGTPPIDRANSPFVAPLAMAVSPEGLTIADGGRAMLHTVDPAGKVVRTVGLPGIATAILAGSITVAALPDAGTILAGSVQMKNVPITGGDGMTLSTPVAIAPAPDGYYAADTRHCAVFLIKNGAAEVVAGACQKDRQVGGFRDGTGNKCSFGTIVGLVSDGKGHIYVADLGNNSIRRITVPQ